MGFDARRGCVVRRVSSKIAHALPDVPVLVDDGRLRSAIRQIARSSRIGASGGRFSRWIGTKSPRAPDCIAACARRAPTPRRRPARDRAPRVDGADRAMNKAGRSGRSGRGRAFGAATRASVYESAPWTARSRRMAARIAAAGGAAGVTWWNWRTRTQVCGAAHSVVETRANGTSSKCRRAGARRQSTRERPSGNLHSARGSGRSGGSQGYVVTPRRVGPVRRIALAAGHNPESALRLGGSSCAIIVAAPADADWSWRASKDWPVGAERRRGGTRRA